MELTLNLPHQYSLVAIRLFHTGEWIVTVHLPPTNYASGQHSDINEATRIAIERCEAGSVTPPYRTPPERKLTIPGLDLSTLNL